MEYASSQLIEVMSATGGRPLPREVVIFPAGWSDVSHADGGERRVLCDERAAREVIANHGALGRDVVVDYEHASIRPGDRHDGTAPAAGWIKALRWQPGRGLVASVDWTARGAARVAAREYRYLSPVVDVDPATLRVRRLYSVGLTNDPAIRGAAALAANRGTALVVAAGQRLMPGDGPGGGGAERKNAVRPGEEDDIDPHIPRDGDGLCHDHALASELGLHLAGERDEYGRPRYREPTINEVVAAITLDNAGEIAFRLGLSHGVTLEQVRDAVREYLEERARDHYDAGQTVIVEARRGRVPARAEDWNRSAALRGEFRNRRSAFEHYLTGVRTGACRVL